MRITPTQIKFKFQSKGGGPRIDQDGLRLLSVCCQDKLAAVVILRYKADTHSTHPINQTTKTAERMALWNDDQGTLREANTPLLRILYTVNNDSSDGN